MNATLQHFLESGIERTENNSRQVNHLRVLNSMILIGALLCPVFFVAFWSRVASKEFFSLYAGIFVSWLAIFLFVRHTKDPVRGGRLLCCSQYLLIAGSTWLLGGAHSFSLAWFMVLPVAAAVAVGKEDLWVWSVIGCATVLFFGLMSDRSGLTADVVKLSDPSSVMALLTGILSVSLMTHVWHAFQTSLSDQLDISLRHLRREAKEKDLLVEIATISSAEDSVANAARIFLDRISSSFQIPGVRYWSNAAEEGALRLVCAIPEGKERTTCAEPNVIRALSERREVVREDAEGALLCVPVVQHEQVLGVIEVQGGGESDPLESYRGVVSQIALRLKEVSLRESASRAVWNEAHHDHLTRLPNRRAFHSVFKNMIEIARERNHRAALLFVDLDGFKGINDSLGHGAGDEVLRQVSRRLMRCLRLTDSLCTSDGQSVARVARVGGDEFTILLDEISSGGDAEVVADRVAKALSEPIQIDGESVCVGASIGISVFPDDAKTMDGLVRCADSAMYIAKGCGESGHARYREAEAGMGGAAFADQIGAAIEKGEVDMHYQPIFTCIEGKLVAAEALMRWCHPAQGMISPSAFIAAAERLGLMSQLGRFQFETALTWFEKNRVLLPKQFRLSLNLSASQIKDSDFVDWLTGRLMNSVVEASDVQIEITETTLISDEPSIRKHVYALASVGLTLAIDDFGTGNLSPSLLKDFPIGRIKLARSFVAGLPDQAEETSVVCAVLGLSRDLGIPIVAEGVEDEAQQEFLAERGCDEMQGFLMGRPVPGEGFIQRFDLMHPNHILPVMAD